MGMNVGESQFEFVLRSIDEAKKAVNALGHSRALSVALTKLDEASMWVKSERELQGNANDIDGPGAEISNI